MGVFLFRSSKDKLANDIVISSPFLCEAHSVTSDQEDRQEMPQPVVCLRSELHPKRALYLTQNATWKSLLRAKPDNIYICLSQTVFHSIHVIYVHQPGRNYTEPLKKTCSRCLLQELNPSGHTTSQGTIRSPLTTAVGMRPRCAAIQTHLEAFPHEGVRGKVLHPILFVELDAHFPLRHYHISWISHDHDRPGFGSIHAQPKPRGSNARSRTTVHLRWWG